MSESGISKQVSKVLLRFDNKIIQPTVFFTSTETVNQIPKDPKKEPSEGSTFKSLQEIYQISLGKLITSTSIIQVPDPQPAAFTQRAPTPTPIIQTPDPHPASFTQRAPTPTLPKSSTQAPSNPSKFQPKLNKNSLKIASRLKTPKDRLTANSTPKLTPRDESYTYRPQINKNSKRIQSKNPETKPRWDTLYSKGKEKQKELEKTRLEHEITQKDLLDCSFRPSVLQPSLNSNPTKTVERLTTWNKHREDKLKEKKENEADKDLKECTFMPKISEREVLGENFSDIKGVAAYIERGRRIQNQGLDASSITHQVNRDINKRRFNELVEALHNELQTMQL